MSYLLFDDGVTNPDKELGDSWRNAAEAKDEPVPRRTPAVKQIERQQHDPSKVTQHR